MTVIVIRAVLVLLFRIAFLFLIFRELYSEKTNAILTSSD